MKGFLGCLALALLVANPTVAHAGEPVTDGPKVSFQDDLISNLAGSWALTRQIRGKVARNSVRAEWVLNHQFLQVHMKDVADPPAYEAIVLIGYSHADRQYVAHWCDTYGGKFSTIGYGTRSGNSIEFRFNYPDGPFFNTFTWHPAEKRWAMRLESQDAGGLAASLRSIRSRSSLNEPGSGEEKAPARAWLSGVRNFLIVGALHFGTRD